MSNYTDLLNMTIQKNGLDKINAYLKVTNDQNVRYNLPNHPISVAENINTSFYDSHSRTYVSSQGYDTNNPGQGMMMPINMGRGSHGYTVQPQQGPGGFMLNQHQPIGNIYMNQHQQQFQQQPNQFSGGWGNPSSGQVLSDIRRFPDRTISQNINQNFYGQGPSLGPPQLHEHVITSSSGTGPGTGGTNTGSQLSIKQPQLQQQNSTPNAPIFNQIGGNQHGYNQTMIADSIARNSVFNDNSSG